MTVSPEGDTWGRANGKVANREIGAPGEANSRSLPPAAGRRDDNV